MLFMLSSSMEPAWNCKRDVDIVEHTTETTENASDRESSIESSHTNKSEPSITTETELIDVDDIELSDEESWLYKSPKKQLSEEKPADTGKWLQKSTDDMDDIELSTTRTALLSKLNQLKLLNSSIEENEAKKDIKTQTFSSIGKKKTTDDTEDSNRSSFQDMDHYNFKSENNHFRRLNKESEQSSSILESCKKSELFDVVDVQKIARLQEESLKQSTYKFLNQTGKKTMSSGDLTPAQIASLNKPASIEVLNTCTDKMNHSSIYSLVPLHGRGKQDMFSFSAFNCSQEFHRGSLPNINKGYYSLKSKKKKSPVEPKVSCPLPVYPSRSKTSSNGTMSQGFNESHIKSVTPSSDHLETRTLPSSYRVHSRSNSVSRRDLNVLPTPRRESMSSLEKNSIDLNQRDNYRKYSSPMPSGTVYKRYNAFSSATKSPTTFNFQPQNLKSTPGLEYHRATSHSPSRRLPLSNVQHQSPRKGSGLAFPNKEEIRALKLPPKIPSTALRSGIPVPSATYTSRPSEDDTWNEDCF